MEVMEDLRNHFSKDLSTLCQYVFTTTYFQWDQDIYEQIDKVTMGLFLVVTANFYMEHSDTFVIWPLGQKKTTNGIRLLWKSLEMLD